MFQIFPQDNLLSPDLELVILKKINVSKVIIFSPGMSAHGKNASINEETIQNEVPNECKFSGPNPTVIFK